MWAVQRDYDDEGRLAFEHVVPCVFVGDDYEVSDAHILSPECPCGPIIDEDDIHVAVVIHHDPDHPGAMSEAEWRFRRASPSPLEAAWCS
jgi:hypothetical protein